MDGLMFDTERVYRYSWITALEKRGLTAQEGFLQDIVGTSGQNNHGAGCTEAHAGDP